MDGREVLADLPRRVPTAMTFGSPVPGARMPRNSGQGSSTERTAVTAESGSRMSLCAPSAFSIAPQVQDELVALDSRSAMDGHSTKPG